MGKIAIKEIFILVLLLIVILFVMGVMFYDYIPSNKVVPEPIEYAADSKVTATLQEIAATTDENVDGEFADDGSLLKSYSIGTSD